MGDQKIRNAFWDSFGRKEMVRNKLEQICFLPPNSSLRRWVKFIESEFPQEKKDDLFDNWAFKRFVHPEEFRENKEIIEIHNHVAGLPKSDEPNYQIPKRDIKKWIREYLVDNKIPFEVRDDGEFNASIRCGEYDLVVCIYPRGGFLKLSYGVKIFKSEEVRIHDNIIFYYLMEYLWGSGSSFWDMVSSKEVLHKAMDELFIQCGQLREVLIEL